MIFQMIKEEQNFQLSWMVMDAGLITQFMSVV